MIAGVCPVLEVPFTAHGDIDESGFRDVARHVMRAGVPWVMFPGFASEYYKLADAERSRLTRLLLELGAAENVRVIISVPDHATVIAVERAKEAVAMGAAAVNVLPPHVLTPDRTGVLTHVTAILDAVPGTPVVLQYAPAQTGTTLDVDTIQALAERHDSAFQVKVEAVPPGPMVTALSSGSRPVTSLIGYAGVQLPDALRRGAVGVQPGCSFVEIYVQIWRLWQGGRIDDALDLHRRLLPYLTYWMQSVELIIQAEKTISKRRGLIADDHCRSPHRQLDAHETVMIEEFLRAFDDLVGPVE